MIEEDRAPIHAKLEKHRKNPKVKDLKKIVNEHHENLPPAFVWAPDLLMVLEDLQRQIDDLKHGN